MPQNDALQTFDMIKHAAWAYYHDGLKQSDIASALKVSRASIVNYLAEARARGYVRVTMHPDVFVEDQLGTELAEAYGLWNRKRSCRSQSDVAQKFAVACRQGGCRLVADTPVGGGFPGRVLGANGFRSRRGGERNTSAWAGRGATGGLSRNTFGICGGDMFSQSRAAVASGLHQLARSFGLVVQDTGGGFVK